MKARPILFSGPMVRALLEGRKTQTRRIVKRDPDWIHPMPCPSVTSEGWQGPLDYSLWAHEGDQADGFPRRCLYGKPGDLLWVRETYAVISVVDNEVNIARAERMPPGKTLANTDGGLETFRVPPEVAMWAEERKDDERWRPSIHMPRWASRITLKLTDVRVERLNAISQADAIAEGIPATTGPFVHHTVADFRKLWSEINGKRSWEANPWVWVLSFTVEKRNVDDVMRKAP